MFTDVVIFITLAHWFVYFYFLFIYFLIFLFIFCFLKKNLSGFENEMIHQHQTLKMEIG